MRIVVAVVPVGYERKYPWQDGEYLLLLGKVENMPGHVVVADQEGKVHWGFHEDSFREARKDEL